LDTGIRASELCELRIYQVDLRNRRLTVMGKGSKERMVPISARTAQAVWRYLAEWGGTRKAEVLFTTRHGLPMNRHGLRRLIKRAGDRAGVERATVHRFRHTFAIEFLRNQPSIFALQRMLGHSSLEMVRRYLAIAQADVEMAHQEGSPVANWAL
jgi:site-specific recombinase XerD